MSSPLPGYLELLYPNKGDELFKMILAEMGEKTSGARRQPTHRDLIFITYAQQFQASTKNKPETLSSQDKPLQQLSNFFNQYLRSCFSAVHLLPFYPATSDGGFAVKSFCDVDTNYGDWKDIEAFNSELMFDWVFNHTSSQHPWFQAFLNGEEKYQNYYHYQKQWPAKGSQLEEDLKKVIRPRSSDLLVPFTKMNLNDSNQTENMNPSKIYVWATFGPDQLDLDFSTPEVFLESLKVLFFYVDRGAKFIRVDAVPFLWKELGTNCLHHPKTHLIVKCLRAALDLKSPEVMLITESNVPHIENISYLDDGKSESQMVYNFSLAPLILYSLVKNSGAALKSWVQSLEPLPEKTCFFNFTASHDGIGVRPLEGILEDQEIMSFAEGFKSRGGRVNYRKLDGELKPYEINITWASALVENDIELSIRKIICSYAMSLVFPGIPGVYFHNLIGSLNWQEGVQKTQHNRDINRRPYETEEFQILISKNPFHSNIFSKTIDLLKVRREKEVFHPEAKFIQLNSPDSIWAVKRQWKNQEGLFLHNLSPEKQHYQGYILEPYGIKWTFNESITE